MDGPVVKAAQAALTAGDINLVLIWVGKDDEAEIRGAFERALSVRKLGPQAREFADEYFFETLVRIHRAAEGAPFTGLRPAGRDLGPAIPAVDQALESGDVASLTNLLVERMRTGVLERYQRANAAKSFRTQDVDAGREYVETYVRFIHYIAGHYSEGAGAARRWSITLP